MKKSLLLGITGITLIALTATTLYAQTVVGSSIIDKMKAAVGNFTLSANLNPGETGLQSAPIAGKKTGSILTAGEWNRVLELISEGGTGGTGTGWVDVPLTDTADYDTTCLYEVKVKTTAALHDNLMNGDMSWRIASARTNKYLGLAFTDGSATTYASWGVPSSNKSTYGYRDSAGTFVPSSGVSIVGMRKICGGGNDGTGAGWENVPLTDTNPFDQQCMYRFVSQGQTYYAETVHENRLFWIYNMYFEKVNKSVLVGGIAPYDRATKIEKFCGGGGGGSGSGGPALYKCTNAQSLDATNAPCYGASRSGGAGTNQYRVVSCTDNDGVRSYTMSSILNFGQLATNKWAVSVNGGTIECDDGTVLVMDIQGGGSSTSSGGTSSPSVISCKKKNSTYATSTLTGQPLVKFTASDCGGTLPDASYNGAIGSLNVCNGAIDHTVYSGGSVNGPGVSFSFRGGYACTWSDGNGYDISVVYMK